MDVSRIENAIISAARKPVSPDSVVEKLTKRGVSAFAVRGAIRSLVDDGRLAVLLDWKIVAKDAPKPGAGGSK